jgi:hypothetical protein
MLRRALLVLAVMAALSSSLFFAPVHARIRDPSTSLVRAGHKDSSYTGFKITAPTEDGGRVDVVFVWQKASKWRGWREGDPLRVYDTYPTLQMVKLLSDGSLDHSVTYITLYLMEFDDVNGNGLFDLRTGRRLTTEIPEEEVDWRLIDDKVLRMYPLAPMFNHYEQEKSSYEWSWKVSEPTELRTEGTSPYEYAWNASSTVRSFGWRFIDSRRTVDRGSMDVHFGYHLTLKPDGPTVKLEYGIEDLNWASGKDVKLALISAVLYHGREQVVIREERKYAGFSEGSAKNQSIALVERAGESVKSLIVHSPDAIVDGVPRTDTVASSLQPMFTVSTPPDVPETVNVKGLNPGFEDRMLWRQSIAFAHQLAFPHFESKVFLDPAVSLVAPLLLPRPSALASPQLFIMSVAIISLVYVLFKVTWKRWLQYPYVDGA